MEAASSNACALTNGLHARALRFEDAEMRTRRAQKRIAVHAKGRGVAEVLTASVTGDRARTHARFRRAVHKYGRVGDRTRRVSHIGY
mgnify:CR=1 FL=1